MKALAELTLDYIWLMMFGDPSQIDSDYAVKLQEQLSLVLPTFTPEEQDALSTAAQYAKARLLAEPDEYGYTPSALVTDQQREFLDAVIAKDIFNEPIV